MNDDLGKTLLVLARHAIADELGIDRAADPTDPALAQPGATFVTLTENGRLRGCIGSLEARRPLGEDVLANARAAAFSDTRFAPLGRDEFKQVRVEVSLLSAAQAMSFSDEEDALRQLRPAIDGVILEAGLRRATFLPQVWESLPEPRQFLAELKYKAGLPAGYWNDNVKLYRYEVQKWKE
jgi:AmmeMemoRadiSam system protein A